MKNEDDLKQPKEEKTKAGRAASHSPAPSEEIPPQKSSGDELPSAREYTDRIRNAVAPATFAQLAGNVVRNVLDGADMPSGRLQVRAWIAIELDRMNDAERREWALKLRNDGMKARSVMEAIDQEIVVAITPYL